jgi:3-phenylpropionate/trans-cinnamate dioxygenase ferredoxin subunit
MRWVKLFKSSQEAEMVVPSGKSRTIKIGATKVCLVHGEQKWYAIENDCPHLGDSLAKGTLNHQEEIICPWHSYRFSLISGREAQQRCRDAHIYPLREEKDGFFIGLPSIEP